MYMNKSRHVFIIHPLLNHTSLYQIYFYTLHTPPYSSHILSFPVKGVNDHVHFFALMQKSQKSIDFIGS